MRDDHQKLLRAMLEARNVYEAATTAQQQAWNAYLRAQAEFTGKFAMTDYPLGPFVVGEILVEHCDFSNKKWPPQDVVFKYIPVIRCPTSE